jgi:hypothetical protein
MLEYGNNITSTNGSKAIQQMTLIKFGFNTTDNDLANYRTFFHHYYNSSTDYDKDVMKSVYYMRENRCLYYTTSQINTGDMIPNVPIYELDGKTETNIYKIIDDNKYDKCIIAAFSMS